MSENQNKPEGEVLVYQTEDGVNRILVRFEGETVWLTQAMMAELYDTSVPNINIHIRNVLEEDELSAEATIKEYLIVRQEGQRQVRRRADAGKANMGLTAWKGGRVIKRDVGTAKNYLDAREIDTLNRITVMFLDQAEFRAQRRQDIRMSDWEAFLDKFLRDTELPVLIGPGTVSREDALDWAQEQYDASAERRRLAAEADDESRYVEDLRNSAKMLETRRTKQPAKNKKPAKSQNQDEKKGPRKGGKS